MLYELKTELNYKIRYFQIDDDPECPEICIGIQPDFDGYNREGNECTVLDFLALLQEMDNNTSYYPITCECGMPDDTGIYAPLRQTVTDTEIWWDISIEDYQWTVSPEYSEQTGTLRIIFNKQQYQQAVKKMNAELRSMFENGIEIATINPDNFIELYGGVYNLEELHKALVDYPQTTYARVSTFHPYGGIDNEKIFD